MQCNGPSVYSPHPSAHQIELHYAHRVKLPILIIRMFIYLAE